MTQSLPITANANAVPPNVNDAPTSGNPQISAVSRGYLKGTFIEVSNDNLDHVCDFVSEMQKNINLKKYTKAIGNQIREAIRYVMRALGFSDATGESTVIINKLKAIARELKRIQKEIIQPIQDFQTYVLAYIEKLKATLQWILSLPQKFLTMLNDCLQKITKLIANVFSDAFAGLSGDSSDEFDKSIAAAKEVATAASDLVKASATVVITTVAIAAQATVGLLIPTNQTDLDAANATIAAYEATPAPKQEQNKSTP
jgi:hypothetical protein